MVRRTGRSADQALLLQVDQHLCPRLHRHEGVVAVQVKQVKPIHPQPMQAFGEFRAQGGSVGAGAIADLRRDGETGLAAGQLAQDAGSDAPPE